MNTAMVSVFGLVVGGAIGAAMAFLTKTYYVPILVPVAIGAAVGMPVAFLVHYRRIIARRSAIAMAIIAWAACVGAFHWTEYRAVFVGEVLTAFDETRQIDGGPPYTDEEARAKADEILENETGHTGFRGFLLYRGRAGLEMRVLQKKVLHPAWSFGLWALDLLILLAVILRIVLGVVRRIDNGSKVVERL